ncbi:MAG: hypothetical protein HKO59_08140, partial [Phycisphaerales bacterium]|nr:hypothetical protein [Phycisphaerales bacterium]
MNERPYDPDRDRPAVQRVWKECGWISDDAQHPAFDTMLSAGTARVVDMHGEAECLVTTHGGQVRYLHDDLPFSLVSAVTTGRVGRKQGIAGRLTARAVAADAANGAAVSGLGMFEQGFYDQLGFGSGPYEHLLLFDPGDLRLPAGVTARAPRRLTAADGPAMHANRRIRRRGHGGCNMDDPE